MQTTVDTGWYCTFQPRSHHRANIQELYQYHRQSIHAFGYVLKAFERITKIKRKVEFQQCTADFERGDKKFNENNVSDSIQLEECQISCHTQCSRYTFSWFWSICAWRFCGVHVFSFGWKGLGQLAFVQLISNGLPGTCLRVSAKTVSPKLWPQLHEPDSVSRVSDGFHDYRL